MRRRCDDTSAVDVAAVADMWRSSLCRSFADFGASDVDTLLSFILLHCTRAQSALMDSALWTAD
jgi:hypothetical protein